MSDDTTTGREMPGVERRLLLSWAVLALLYSWPLTRLFRHAWSTELHSHIILIPIVCWYLWQQNRSSWALLPGRNPVATGALAALAAGALGWSFTAGSGENRIVLQAASFVLALWAAVAANLRWASIRQVFFVPAFLVFLIPLPEVAVVWVESWLMTASADATDWLFKLANIPALRNGQVFELPNVILEVARECSGIRSSWVLFITSILAAHLFLRKPLNKAILILAVIPLGILRNALRITTIAYLCIEHGAHMINSWVHHRGGPLFFAISLVPLFVLLLSLRWLEGRKLQPKGEDEEKLQSEIAS